MIDTTMTVSPSFPTLLFFGALLLLGDSFSFALLSPAVLPSRPSSLSCRSSHRQRTFLRSFNPEPPELNDSDGSTFPERAFVDPKVAAAKKAAELRAQEVFIKRETGIFKCSTCDYQYDEAEGDTKMIGGTNPPGTKFVDLPMNYRCPTCRGSKDGFEAVVKEIAGFEVNQGYGFGTNGMTGDEKNTLIFGGLAFFFLLFIGGYAMS